MRLASYNAGAPPIAGSPSLVNRIASHRPSRGIAANAKDGRRVALPHTIRYGDLDSLEAAVPSIVPATATLANILAPSSQLPYQMTLPPFQLHPLARLALIRQPAQMCVTSRPRKRDEVRPPPQLACGPPPGVVVRILGTYSVHSALDRRLWGCSPMTLLAPTNQR